MDKPIKQWLRQNLKFTRKDRNAIIILGILILLTLTFNLALDYIEPNDVDFDYSEYEKLLGKQKNKMHEKNANNKVLFPFDPNIISAREMDSLAIPDFIKRNIQSYRNAGGKFKIKDDLRKIYGMNDSIFESIKNYLLIPENRAIEIPDKIVPKEEISGYFDPNHSGLNELTKFGFNSFQANNVLEYRKNGGSFITPEDLLKIYGIDSLFYYKIEAHIQIKINSDFLIPVEKEKTYVEINSADSVQFVELNGVGPVFASRILKYREILGGFVSKSQLLEVYNFPEETFDNIKDNLIVDTLNLKKIRLNFSDFSDLIRHPYLNKENVNSIINYRNQNGSYLRIDQILEAGLVDTATFFSIKPYLSTR